MLKALLFVLEQASQRTAAAGGGKDEQSFTNDANGAPCYERPDGHAPLATLPALLTCHEERRLSLALSGSCQT